MNMQDIEDCLDQIVAPEQSQRANQTEVCSRTVFTSMVVKRRVHYMLKSALHANETV